MLLNKGVDPRTSCTVVPHFAFGEMTTAHSVVSGYARKPTQSIVRYGMAWMRVSVTGHDV